jgi:uncharacterized protein (DUF1330 family)
MTAYAIADVEVTDPGVFEDYRGRVGDTIAKYGGRYVVRGGKSEVVEGNWNPKRLVVLEFPSMERLQAWYHSPEYAPLKQLRFRSANTDVVLVEGV